MSYFEPDSLSPRDFIAQYIIEVQNRGHMLPYTDYSLIENWLSAANGDKDQLLLVLSDILPEYFGRDSDRKRSLKGVDKTVKTNISNFIRQARV